MLIISLFCYSGIATKKAWLLALTCLYEFLALVNLLGYKQTNNPRRKA